MPSVPGPCLQKRLFDFFVHVRLRLWKKMEPMNCALASDIYFS